MFLAIFFTLKSEAEEHERKNRAEADIFKEKEEFYTKKYGWRAANGIMYNDCTEERYIKTKKEIRERKGRIYGNETIQNRMDL